MPDFSFVVPRGYATPPDAQGERGLVRQDNLLVELDCGEAVFVLGANGTGKSSLMWSIHAANRQRSVRILSQRQNWFDDGGLNITGQQRTGMGVNIANDDMQVHSRWRDTYAATRTSIALYDLIDRENLRARAITNEVDGKNIEKAEELSSEQSPLGKLNELLKLVGLPIRISIDEAQALVAHRASGPPYDIAQLSDGERNALLLAAKILTPVEPVLFIIDEPERHLHRSIIAPMLALLFRQRSDCAFVVATHDVELALDHPSASKLLLRSCAHAPNQDVEVWDADLAQPNEAISESLMREILGARRKVVFVEGAKASLDLPMYATVLPGASVIPKDSCVDVKNAVYGIRSADGLHWVSAFGIVDGDGQGVEQINALRADGIYAVQAYSVEALYYHPVMQRIVATAHVAVVGGTVGELMSAASAATISAVRASTADLASRVVEKSVRASIMSQYPNRRSVGAGVPVSIEVDVAALMQAEIERLEAACNDADLVTIICRYPVRHAGALNRIASALRFQNRTAYEDAVRQQLLSNNEAVDFVRSLLGELYADITA